MAKPRTQWYRSRFEAIRTVGSVSALVIAIVALWIANQAITVVNEVDVEVRDLDAEIDQLSNTIDDLTTAVSGIEGADEPSWHVLHDETINDTNSNKFFIPPEALKIRVIWGESLSFGNTGVGPGYLCWEDGYDETACYMNTPILVDTLMEIQVDLLPQDKRLLFIDMGTAMITSAEVHVDGWW